MVGIHFSAGGFVVVVVVVVVVIIRVWLVVMIVVEGCVWFSWQSFDGYDVSDE